jgi:two-component system response regulator
MDRYHAFEILLVEDNPDDMELTLRALKKHNLANNVHVARDGVEALDYIYGTEIDTKGVINNRPKIVLLDLRLPKVDGLEVLKKMKSDERTKTIPVIILTSSSEERDLVDSYELGVNSYIVKPVDFEKFIQSVSEIGVYWMVMNKQPS